MEASEALAPGAFEEDFPACRHPADPGRPVVFVAYPGTEVYCPWVPGRPDLEEACFPVLAVVVSDSFVFAGDAFSFPLFPGFAN